MSEIEIYGSECAFTIEVAQIYLPGNQEILLSFIINVFKVDGGCRALLPAQLLNIFRITEGGL